MQLARSPAFWITAGRLQPCQMASPVSLGLIFRRTRSDGTFAPAFTLIATTPPHVIIRRGAFLWSIVFCIHSSHFTVACISSVFSSAFLLSHWSTFQYWPFLVLHHGLWSGHHLFQQMARFLWYRTVHILRLTKVWFSKSHQGIDVLPSNMRCMLLRFMGRPVR